MKVVLCVKNKMGGKIMSDENLHSRVDYLALVIALVQHIEEGNCCDDINDARLFRGPVNRIISKVQLVIDENFGGDSSAFKRVLFEKLFYACVDNGPHLQAIENWLDKEWKESAELYAE